jgi:hypothetical protein
MRPNTRLALPSFVLLIAMVSIGCQTQRPANHTFVSANAPAQIYVSDMAFSFELTDPATGMPEHATAGQLRPFVLREAERLTFEPLLRVVLNQPAVQATRWYGQFDDDMDDALFALREAIGVRNVEDSPLIYVYATAAHRDDAQIILTALRDEYLRRHKLREVSTQQEAMEAAQRRHNAAQEQVTSIQAEIKRFLTNTPIDALSETTSEAALQVKRLTDDLDDLERRCHEAEALYQRMIKRQTEGDFDPSDVERMEIENHPSIKAIDRQLLEHRVQQAVLQAQETPDEAALQQKEKAILALERERLNAFDEQFRMVFNARLESLALQRRDLASQREQTRQSLEAWTVKRQEQVRRKHAYKTLLREQRAAEAERNRARERVAEHIERDRQGASPLGYRVVLEYPPQRAWEENAD